VTISSHLVLQHLASLTSFTLSSKITAIRSSKHQKIQVAFFCFSWSSLSTWPRRQPVGN